jgi:hypothetical protein
MTPSAAAALAVGMDPPTTPAPPRQWAVQFLGLNITRAYARHLYTCRTRLSSPLLHLILATVLFLDILVMWRFLVPDVKPCHHSITY